MRGPAWHLGEALAALLRLPVHVYRLAVSPYLPMSCRFHPTCSGYALEALRVHGPFRGGRLVVGRLLRCHPWGGQGYDPVPAAGDDPAPCRHGVSAN